MRMNKKGQVLTNLGALAIGVATFAIVLAIAFLVMAQTADQVAVQEGVSSCDSVAGNTSTACNATRELREATDTLPGWIPLIVIVVIGGTILAMVKTFGR